MLKRQEIFVSSLTIILLIFHKLKYTKMNNFIFAKKIKMAASEKKICAKNLKYFSWATDIYLKLLEKQG